MTVGILGSGFGLYGYLPSLVGFNERIVLPSRYRQKLAQRRDVGHLAEHVTWADGDNGVMAAVDTLIVTRRPADQVECVMQALGSPNIGRFILEKPLAPDPGQAHSLLQRLEDAAKRVRVGFTFRLASWADQVSEWVRAAGSGAKLAFTWRFRAQHYALDLDTWKRRPAEGGGALRFYGVHLIALLAEHGYLTVSTSGVAGTARDDAAVWTATFNGPGLPECRLELDCNASDSLFLIEGRSAAEALELCVRLRDPYEQHQPTGDGFDRRVDGLSRLYRSLRDDPEDIPALYLRSVALWSRVEAATQFSTTRRSGC